MPEIKFLALKVIVVGGAPPLSPLPPPLPGVAGQQQASPLPSPPQRNIGFCYLSSPRPLHASKFDYVHRSEFLSNSLALIFNLCDGGDGLGVCHNPRRAALERLGESLGLEDVRVGVDKE